jgi:hypothetical protein
VRSETEDGGMIDVLVAIHRVTESRSWLGLVERNLLKEGLQPVG